MDGPRILHRLLVLLALLLFLLESTTVFAVIERADAAELPRSSKGPSAITSAAPVAASRADRPITPSGTRPARSADEAAPGGHLLVHLERSRPLFARPNGRRIVGEVPATSPFYGVPTAAWVLEISEDGRFGRVPIPYAGRDATGWLRLRGLRQSTTRVSVLADLSRNRLWVLRADRIVLSVPAASGRAASPTPVGRYVVSDVVEMPVGGPYGSLAFGLSGIQPNLPDGWTGGDQLAIHGTDDPSSIGTRASAGCLRVSERALDRLRRLLDLGTPVVVRA